MPAMRFTGTVSFVTQNGSTFARATYKKDDQRKQIWRKVTDKKSDAKAEVVKEIERILNDEPDKVKTFHDLAEYYKKTRAIPAEYRHDEKIRGAKTHKQLKSVVSALDSFYRDTELHRLTRDAVQRYRIHILEKSVRRVIDDDVHLVQRSVASINQHLRTLRAMLNVAKQERWIDEVPSFKGLISSAAEARREAYPTPEQFQAILMACMTRQRLNHVRPIALMIAETGARPIELWNLTWGDIDFENESVTYTSDKGVRRSRRTVPLTKIVLRELMELPRNGELVFGVKSIKRAWKSVCKIAKVEVDLYSLRHLFATRLDMMSISQNQKQKMMGHLSSQMFGRYAKLTDETVDVVRDLLNENPY